MSRSSILLAALTDEPTSTSDLYDRVGYAALLRAGLIQYEAFRDELTKLAAEGKAARTTGPDDTSLWRLPTPPEPDGAA